MLSLLESNLDFPLNDPMEAHLAVDHGKCSKNRGKCIESIDCRLFSDGKIQVNFEGNALMTATDARVLHATKLCFGSPLHDANVYFYNCSLEPSEKFHKIQPFVEHASIKHSDYFVSRSKALDEWKKRPETDPYSTKFNVSLSMKMLLERFGRIENGQRLEGVNVSIAGRVLSVRSAGETLSFYDLHGEGVDVRAVANKSRYGDETSFMSDTGRIRRGDVVGVEGFPAKTENGTLLLVARRVSPASYSCSVPFFADQMRNVCL